MSRAVPSFSVGACALVCAALLHAILASPVFAYRTAADLDDMPDDQWIRWRGANDVLALGIDPTSRTHLEGVREALTASAIAWNTLSCGAPTLTTGIDDDPVVGDSVPVAWLDAARWESMSFGDDVAATTDLVYRRGTDGTWSISEAAVYVNEDGFSWSGGTVPDPRDARDLRAVLTHELGHVLGLLHPCEPGGAGGAPRCETHGAAHLSTMYPLYRGPSQASLGDDDAAGICDLYGPERCSAGCDLGSICVDGLCLFECGTDRCLPDETCTIDGCQPTDCEGGGSCLGGSGSYGDPCDGPADCASSFCSASGICVTPCGAGGVCTSGTVCDTSEIPLCQPAAGTLGAACGSASDCLERICVGSNRRAPMCSRSCETASPCPEGFECAPVGARDVCLPRAEVSGGCAIRATSPPGLGLLAVSILLLPLLARRSRS